MEESIKNAIKALLKEIEDITTEKSQLENRLHDLEIRTHQIVGAIHELEKLTANSVE